MRQGYPLPSMINSEPRQIFEAPYQITLGGVERIADRSAQLVLVDRWMVIAIVISSGSMKRRLCYYGRKPLTQQSQTLEQFEFSELTIGPQSVEVAGGHESLQVKVYPITWADAVLQFSP